MGPHDLWYTYFWVANTNGDEFSQPLAGNFVTKVEKRFQSTVNTDKCNN